jgi:photosystem II stability/assembly factor-like uncharacterized protein
MLKHLKYILSEFKCILFLIPLLSFCQPALCQWEFVNPLPDGYPMYCVSFCDSANGWALGANSTRHFVNNQWITQPTDTTIPTILRVKMISPNEGWGIGNLGTIYHYTGSNWQLHYTVAGRNLNDIEFTNANNGWVVGDSGTIFHYDGSSWSPQACPVNKKLLSVFFINDSVGYAGGEKSNFLKYKNGSWTQVSLNPYTIIYDIYDIAALDTNNIYLATILGEVLHFDGTAWSLIVTPNGGNLKRIVFTDPQHGWALGTGGAILFSDGTNWSIQYYDTIPFNNPVMDICFTDSTNGYAVGLWGLLYHWDGVNWTKLSSTLTYTTLRDIYAIDTTHIHSTSLLGIIGNNGAGWQTFINALVNTDYKNIDFYDNNNGWAAGQGPKVGYWNGTNWTIQTTPGSGYSLFDVDVVDLNHVWASGEDVILFWDGTTWTQQWTSAPISKTIRGIAFADSTNGWACGDFGTVLHYQSGAWTTVPGFNATSVFYGIEFTDANHGWMVERYYDSPASAFKTVIHFYNGINWTATDTLISSGSSATFHFRDSMHGTLSIGLFISYLQYENGVWSTKFIDGMAGAVTAVYFVDSLNAWACGGGGIVMRTRNGGVVTDANSLEFSTLNKSNLKCFPNPVSNNSIISYNVAQKDMVRLDLFTVDGKHVRNFVNKYQDSGIYSFNLNKYLINSGMYFCRLIIGSDQEIIRIIVN